MTRPEGVVDTNVAAVANGANPEAGPSCRAASAAFLHRVMKEGHVYLDAGGLIIDEYKTVLTSSAHQPEPGSAFLRWLLQNQYVAARVTHVTVTSRTGGRTSFVELPDPPTDVTYDKSDEKFLAVAVAHPSKPSVFQSFDSKWWGWTQAMADCGVKIEFLCPAEIEAKYLEKTELA